MAWVRFPELPLELFDEEVLYAMGNTLGKTVKIDHTTLVATRGKYARTCMEIDLSKPLIPFLLILGCKKKVEYEGLHLICFECGKYGHRLDDCPQIVHAPSSQSGTLATLQTVGEGHTDKAEDQPFGPWMLPRNDIKKVGGKVNDSRYGGRVQQKHQGWATVSDAQYKEHRY